MKKFGLENGNFFDEFAGILINTAESKWEVLVGDIPEVEQTNVKIDEVIKAFYLSFSTHTTRDDMYQYLMDKCHKPVG